VRRQVRSADIDDRPAIGQSGVVVDDQDPVTSAAHVELDGVAAERRSQSERLDGVLGRRSRRPTMSQYRYQRYPPSVVTM
jgi:hypothetical protein